MWTRSPPSCSSSILGIALCNLGHGKHLFCLIALPSRLATAIEGCFNSWRCETAQVCWGLSSPLANPLLHHSQLPKQEASAQSFYALGALTTFTVPLPAINLAPWSTYRSTSSTSPSPAVRCLSGKDKNGRGRSNTKANVLLPQVRHRTLVRRDDAEAAKIFHTRDPRAGS